VEALQNKKHYAAPTPQRATQTFSNLRAATAPTYHLEHSRTPQR
jgi:hypothetical protein